MDYVPDRIIKADNHLNKIMIGLNIAIPVIYASFLALANFWEIEYDKKPFRI